MICVDECDGSEKETITHFVKLGYLSVVTDNTPYRNSTPYRQITQAGEAALSQTASGKVSSIIAVLAFIISATTLVLSVLGVI